MLYILSASLINNIYFSISYNYYIFTPDFTLEQMDWKTLSNPAIMIEIGKRLKSYRIRKNLSQKELASRAGISVLSVQNLEKGRFVTMVTFISILRMLKLLGNIEILVPELPISPVELLKLKGKTRKRVQKRNKLQ